MSEVLCGFLNRGGLRLLPQSLPLHLRNIIKLNRIYKKKIRNENLNVRIFPINGKSKGSHHRCSKEFCGGV